MSSYYIYRDTIYPDYIQMRVKFIFVLTLLLFSSFFFA